MEKEKRKFKVSQLLTLYLFKKQHSKTIANATQSREETNSTTNSAHSSAALTDEHTSWTVSRHQHTYSRGVAVCC